MDMSDAVIDQFKIGVFGTSTIESLAGSIPVITYLNDDNFTKYKISQPPLINCKTEDDIESSINLIIKDSKYLDRVSLEIKRNGTKKLMNQEMFHFNEGSCKKNFI